MTDSVSQEVLDKLFNDARTANAWLNKPVSIDQIHALYDLMKMAPTSANCSPARLVFVMSDTAKARLKPHLMDGNVKKVMAAPVTVIIGYDENFAALMPMLFPHDLSAKDWFADPKVAFDTAFRNSTLQGGYLIMAARSLGLDCGPLSGFDKDGVDAEFFAGTSIKSNFLCSIGYGSKEDIFPRSPRLDFDRAAEIL